MGISRSALYLNALMEYLKRNNRKNITQKLNEVYSDASPSTDGATSGDGYYKEFEPMSNAALESIRELTKNDTW